MEPETIKATAMVALLGGSDEGGSGRRLNFTLGRCWNCTRVTRFHVAIQLGMRTIAEVVRTPGVKLPALLGASAQEMKSQKRGNSVMHSDSAGAADLRIFWEYS